MKKVLFSLIFGLCTIFTYAQDTAKAFVHKDPLAFAKMGHSNALYIGFGTVTTENNNPLKFNSETYYVKRRSPGAAIQFGENWGWRFYDKNDDDAFLLNYGIEADINSIHVFDSSRNELAMSQAYLSIPISYGFRAPLHTVKHHDKYYAIEWKLGAIFSWCNGTGFSYWNNYTLPDYQSKGNYFKIGLFMQWDWSFLDNGGHGHIISLKLNSDIGKGAIFGAGNSTPPLFSTITLSYNIDNNYYHK